MGRDKALLEYRGRTFLANILNTLREAGIERVVVVLGYHAEEIRKASISLPLKWWSTKITAWDKLPRCRRDCARLRKTSPAPFFCAWSITRPWRPAPCSG